MLKANGNIQLIFFTYSVCLFMCLTVVGVDLSPLASLFFCLFLYWLPLPFVFASEVISRQPTTLFTSLPIPSVIKATAQGNCKDTWLSRASLFTRMWLYTPICSMCVSHEVQSSLLKYPHLRCASTRLCIHTVVMTCFQGYVTTVIVKVNVILQNKLTPFNQTGWKIKGTIGSHLCKRLYNLWVSCMGVGKCLDCIL